MHPVLKQQKVHKEYSSLTASGTLLIPKVLQTAQRCVEASQQPPQLQPPQQQSWVSNEQLWRQAIQQKHAQKRRRQQLQHLQQHLSLLPRPGAAPEELVSLVKSTEVQLQHPAGIDPYPQYLAAPQEQEHQQQPLNPRALTSAILTASDGGQLLLLLAGAQQLLDAIHVAAAMNQCSRGLVLNLQLPVVQDKQQDTYQQQAHEQSAWLRSLDDRHVQEQLHLVQVHAQLDEGRDKSLQRLQVQQPDWILLLLLCQAIQQHAPSMGSQELCSCLSGCTRLLQQHEHTPLLISPLFSAASQQLLLAAHRQLGQLDPRGLSLVLHAAAGFACSPGGFSPNAAFMRDWYRASRRQLQSFNQLDLAMCVGALGRMQKFPPMEWMTTFMVASRAALPGFGTHELLLLLLGVAGTRRHPPKAWTAAALQHLQPQLPHMHPAQLSTAIMACARLNHVPTMSWLSEFSSCWEEQQLQCNAREHATILWALGVIRPRFHHRDEWAKKLQAALQQVVARAATAVAAVAMQKIRLAAQQKQQQPSAAAQQHVQLIQQHDTQSAAAAVVSSSVAAHDKDSQVEQPPHHQHKLSTSEPSGHEEGAAQEGEVQLHHAPVQQQPELLGSASLLHPTDCAMIIYGLGRLGPSSLSPTFPGFWLAQARAQLVNMNTQELTMCLLSLAKLHLRPPESWLQQHLHCSAMLARTMTHRQLAMTWWSCAKLRYLPNLSVTAELLMSTAEQLPRFSSHSLALTLWSLGALRMRPNKEWMQLVLEHVTDRLRVFDGRDLCGVLVGLHALGYHPGAPWLDTFTGVVAAKVGILTTQEHKRITSVLQAYGYTCQDKSFAWVMNPALVAAMRHTTQANTRP